MSNQFVTRELIGQFSNRLADPNLRVLEMQTQDGVFKTKHNKKKRQACRCCAEWWNQAEADNSVGKRLALMALMIPEQEDKERCYPSSTQGSLAKRGWRTGVFMRGLMMALIAGRCC